jgi:N-acetylmuramoyl-L-alanine amidase
VRLVCHALLVAVTVFLAGCAAGPRVAPLPPERTLEGLCGKYSMNCAWDGVSQTVTMYYHGQKIQALVGSRIVIVGAEKLSLSAPLGRRQGAVVVPEDFEKMVFAPERIAGAGTSASGRLFARVVVDAGHGGKDSGAVGFCNIKEKDIDLDLARRVARNFKDAGVDVILTRDQDEFIPLDGRTDLASRPDVDFFLSIHANANKNHRARGVEVYYSGALGKEDKSEDQRRHNEKKVCSLFNMRKDSETLNRVVAGMLYAYKMRVSAAMAEAVSRGMGTDLGQSSRGSKTARYFVLRNTLVPAILVEVGFISNPREAVLLKEGRYRQKIADAITQSLLRYAYATGM